MDNYTENRKWSVASGLAFWGITVQSAFNVIGLAVGLFLAYNMADIILGGIVPSLMSGSLGYYEDRIKGYGAAIFICWFLSLFGYFCYLAGVCLFVGAQSSESSKAKARNIMIVELVMPILLILYFVILYKAPNIVLDSRSSAIAYSSLPFIGSLAAVIILRCLFGGLAKEKTWTDMSKEGARDAKVSYSLILWIVGVLILWIIIVAATIIDYMSILNKVQYSSYSYGDMYQGIHSYAKQVEAFVGTIKIETLLFGLVLFGFTVTSVIKRAMGWHKIRKCGNEEISQSSGDPIVNSDTARFCHKCGAQLPEGAAFCHVCGTAVAILQESEPAVDKPDEYKPDENVYVSEEIPDYTHDVDIVKDFEEEEPADRKKWLVLGGIAAGIIVLVACMLTLCSHQDIIETNAMISANSSFVYESVKSGTEDSFLCELPYGTPVQIAGDTKDSGKWTEVLFVQDGKVMKGYIHTYDLMDPEEFATLDNAGFNDPDIRGNITEIIQRRAIADAAGRLSGKWSVETLDDTDMYANAKYVIVRNASPSQDCFVFSLQNEDNKEQRKAFVYCTPGVYGEGIPDQPIYLYEEDIPIDKSTIVDVKYDNRKKRYDISYLIGYGYCGEDEEGTDEDLPFVPFPKADDYYMDSGDTESSQIILSGKIDGKYGISFDLYTQDNHTVGGEIRYQKYNIPIDVSGRWSGADSGDKEIIVNEYADGKMTGTFSGIYDGNTYSGTWTSADGKRQMPFRATR